MMWPVKTLGEVATWGSGGTPKRSESRYFGEGIPWLSIADLNDGVVTQAQESLTALGIQNSSAKVVPAGTLLVAKYGSIGKLGIAGMDQCTSQAIAFARPDPEVVDTQYLFHFLLHERPRLQRRGRGGTQMNIGQGDLKAWPVPLPPLDEQRRIAAILDQADAVRVKRRQALTYLDGLAQSIFRDMFGDWTGEKRTVEEIARPEKGAVRTGPFGSQLRHSEFVDDGVAVLGIDNVVTNHFRWGERRFITPAKYEQLKRYTVTPGDVLITIMGTCGRCVVVPEDIGTAINTKHLCAITVDRSKVLPEFVRASFLWHPESRRHLLRRAKGSIMEGLNMGIIKEMPLPVPPVSLQTRFVEHVRAVEGHLVRTGLSEAAMAELVSSLQQRAFSGRL